MLWECNESSGNPEKQPLPVWSISGKPYVAGDRVNGDLGWSPPDNKVGGGAGGQWLCERKQKENKWEGHVMSGKAHRWLDFLSKAIGSSSKILCRKIVESDWSFWKVTMRKLGAEERAIGNRLFRISGEQWGRKWGAYNVLLRSTECH